MCSDVGKIILWHYDYFYLAHSILILTVDLTEAVSGEFSNI